MTNAFKARDSFGESFVMKIDDGSELVSSPRTGEACWLGCNYYHLCSAELRIGPCVGICLT